MSSSAGYHEVAGGPDVAPDDEPGAFRSAPRAKRDQTHAWTFAAVLFATYACGVAAWARAGATGAAFADADALALASACPSPSSSPPRSFSALGASSRARADDDESRDVTFARFARLAAPRLALVLAGAFALGFAFLVAFQRRAEALCYAIVAAKTALVVAALALVAFGEDGSAVPGWARPAAILLALAYVFAMYLWRREIRLVAKLLAVASASVRENPLIVAAVLAVKFVALFVLVPVLAFVLAALRNGSIAPNPDARVSRDGETCVARADDGAAASSSGSDSVSCCVFELDAWVPPYVALALFCLLWSAHVAQELRVFLIAGTVGRWYYAPPGTRLGARRGVAAAARDALGPQFGTVALGALVLSAVALVRELARNARERSAERRRGTLGGGGGIGVVTVLACAASCCLECVAALVAFVSKFATIRAALSGEAFCDAARSVARLFAANGMSAYGVWWLPGYLLSGAMFVFAAAYAWAAFGASGGWMRLLGRSGCVLAPSDETIGDESIGAFAAGVGVCAFLVAFATLQFCARVLLDAVDAAFVCYVQDRDAAARDGGETGVGGGFFGKPEHARAFEEVFAATRRNASEGGGETGAVVRGPDGGIAYAAPSAPIAPEEAA